MYAMIESTKKIGDSHGAGNIILHGERHVFLWSLIEQFENTTVATYIAWNGWHNWQKKGKKTV